jgi:hypothetical protein
MSEAFTMAQIIVDQIRKRIKDINTLDLGVVTAVNVDGSGNSIKYTIDVVMRDTGDITSYLVTPTQGKEGLRLIGVPISSVWRGDGFGIFALPKVGQVVIIAFMNKYLEDPVIVGMMDRRFVPKSDGTGGQFVTDALPSIAIKDGEVLIINESGGMIKLDENGDIVLKFADTYSVGTGAILSGQSSIVINNTRVTTNSKIFITGEDVNSTGLWVDTIVNVTSFKVNRSGTPATQANFHYLIVDV